MSAPPPTPKAPARTPVSAPAASKMAAMVVEFGGEKRHSGLPFRVWTLSGLRDVEALRPPLQTMWLRRVPIPEISIATSSPGLRNFGGLNPSATPTGRTGRDDVARLQRDGTRDRRDDGGNIEDEIAHNRILPKLSVDAGRQVQRRHIRDGIGGSRWRAPSDRTCRRTCPGTTACGRSAPGAR